MAVFSLLVLLLILPVSHSSTTAACKSQIFHNKKTFDNCLDLPTLNATLHYTYNPSTSVLSMAFTAKSIPINWIAWGINPEQLRMQGTQALIAGKYNGPLSPLTVDTFVAGKGKGDKGPISYNVTGLSTEESAADSKFTLFGDWVLPKGQSMINSIWQVGFIFSGTTTMHSTARENLESTMKLSLVPSGGSAVAKPSAVAAPTEAPEPQPNHVPEPISSSSTTTTVNQAASMPPEPKPAISGAEDDLLLRSGFGLVLVGFSLVVFSLF